MALPSSGAISFGDVRTELGLSGEISSSTINGERNGVASTATKSMSELRGDSYQHREVIKILPSDGNADYEFGLGCSISKDGNTAISGLGFGGSGGSSPQGSYIFTRTGSSWTQQAKIVGMGIEDGEFFGRSSSISDDGNTLVVGADRNAVYIFTRSGSSWSQQARIQPNDGVSGDFFGRSVSISGDGNNLIVGAHRNNSVGYEAGAAYIFVRSGNIWTQQAKIIGNDTEGGQAPGGFSRYIPGDGFGSDVSISGDGNTVLVGAYREDEKNYDAGAAYIFTRSGTSWSQQAKISSNEETDYYFGEFGSISDDGNTVIIATSNRVSAYIFTRSGSSWSQQATLDIGRPTSDVSISGDGNVVVVGVKSESTNAPQAGASYIFTRSGSSWSQESILRGNGTTERDYFGRSVAISKDKKTVIIGANGDDDKGDESGCAYIFQRFLQ